MAMTYKNRVVRFTADNDSYGDAATKGMRIKGVRLIAGSDAATALVKVNDTNGFVLYSLKAAANSSDECQLCTPVQEGIIHVDMTGTSPEVYVYLE